MSSQQHELRSCRGIGPVESKILCLFCKLNSALKRFSLHKTLAWNMRNTDRQTDRQKVKNYEGKMRVFFFFLRLRKRV
jgi:hypothetical protein